jgi:hypothetical protein
LHLKHWRSETIQGQASRSVWIEPDLTPLPSIHSV